MNLSRKPRQTTLQQLGPYMGMGFQLAAAMCAFGALGWFLDSRLGTSPWLMVVGLILGATGAMISIIRAALKSGSTKQEKEER